MSRILMLRGDGIGDALVLTPLVAALRDAGHELGAVLSAANQDAFAQRAFARLHVLERIPWPRHGSTRASYARVRAEIRSVGYDAVLIASEEPEAYRLAGSARISKRIGFYNGWEKPFKSWWVRTQLTRALYRPASATREILPEVETMFALGEGLHSEPSPTRDLARLRPLVLDEEPSSDPRIALQISPKFASVGLGPGAFSALSATLSRRYRLIALASPPDAEFARAAVAGSGVELEVPLDVRRWKARIAAVRAVVTPDSGAAHVAGMCGTPAVVLFVAGPALARDTVRWRPWAAPSRILAIDPTGGPRFDERVAEAAGTLVAPAPAGP